MVEWQMELESDGVCKRAADTRLNPSLMLAEEFFDCDYGRRNQQS
jgi:hypothetical protein